MGVWVGCFLSVSRNLRDSGTARGCEWRRDLGKVGVRGRQCPGECGVSPGGPPVLPGTQAQFQEIVTYVIGSLVIQLGVPCFGVGKEVLLPSQPFSLHSRHVKKTVLKGRFWHSVQSVVHGEPWVLEALSGSACGKQDRNPLDREGTKQVYFVSEPKFPRTTSLAKDVFGMHFSRTSRERGV